MSELKQFEYLNEVTPPVTNINENEISIKKMEFPTYKKGLNYYISTKTLEISESIYLWPDGNWRKIAFIQKDMPHAYYNTEEEANKVLLAWLEN